VKRVQIVLDERLLAALDREARRAKVNRSALVRAAIRSHLRRQKILGLERRHREGYERLPPTEFDAWDEVAACT